MIRRVSAALALSAFVSMFGVARGGAQVKSLGCAVYGYTLRVPSTWIVHGTCSPAASVDGSVSGITLNIFVNKHGFWSAQRSAATFQTDLVRKALRSGAGITKALNTSHGTLNGRKFDSAAMVTHDSHGYYLRTELIAFFKGETYRLAAVISLGADSQAIIDQRTGLYSGVLESLMISGPRT